jgi:hypothetical protein
VPNKYNTRNDPQHEHAPARIGNQKFFEVHRFSPFFICLCEAHLFFHKKLVKGETMEIHPQAN